MLRTCRCAAVLLAILILPFALSGCGRIRSEEPNASAQTTENYAPPEQDAPPESSESPMDSEPPQRQSLTVLFFSDTQPYPQTGDYTGFGELSAQAAAREDMPDLIIFGGDTVNDGGDEAEWREFMQAAGTCLEEPTTAAAAGNHDNYPLLARQFDYPFEAPAGQSEGYFYTLSMGSVFFIVLDSNIMGAANQADIEWLHKELQSEAARQAGWIVAVMHHPMWPVTDNPKDLQRAETMRENFLPLLEDYGVALILCGHQHVYSRTLPMRGGSIADGEQGIVQIMAASGDKATYAIGEQGYIAASAPAPNYLLLIANDQSLDITAFDGEGRVIDQVISNK